MNTLKNTRADLNENPPTRILAKTFELFIYFTVGTYWVLFTVVRRRGIPAVDLTDIIISKHCLSLALIVIAAFSVLFANRVRLLSNREKIPRSPKGFELVYIATLVSLTALTGGRYDYASYKLQWEAIYRGQNPWGHIEGELVNAYGPIHNLFAFPYSVWSALPKILFVGGVLLTYAWISRSQKIDLDSKIALALIGGPFILSASVIYGFMDAVPAALICMSVLAIMEHKMFLSGALLSCGIFSKFYPALLAPVFIVYAYRSGGYPHVKRLVASLAGSCLVIAMISWLIWGNSILTPLLFASERDPSLLTAWRLAPQAFSGASKVLITGSTVIFSICLLLRSKKRSVLPGHALAGTLCLIFGFYQLGHQQFYLSIYMLLPICVAETKAAERQSRPPREIPVYFVLGWLTFLQVTFDLLHEFKLDSMIYWTDYFSILNTAILLGAGFMLGANSVTTIEPKSQV